MSAACPTCQQSQERFQHRYETDCINALQTALAQVTAERGRFIEDAAHREIKATRAQQQVQTLRAALLAIRSALPFSRAWAQEHARDDHMVTLDHKDELDVADFLETLYAQLDAALADGPEAGG